MTTGQHPQQRPQTDPQPGPRNPFGVVMNVTGRRHGRPTLAQIARERREKLVGRARHADA